MVPGRILDSQTNLLPNDHRAENISTTNKTLIGLNYLADQNTFLIEYCLSWQNRYHCSSFQTVKQNCQNQAVFVGLTFISLPAQVRSLAIALFHINRQLC